MIRQSSRAEIYLHFVWATYRRMPLISDAMERALYACIMSQAHRAGCEVLAIGGMPDHIHLAVMVPTTIAPAQLMKQVKGASSSVARRDLAGGNAFGWQDGYGAFSFSRSHRDRVVAYVRNQKTHHASGDVWSPWEAMKSDADV